MLKLTSPELEKFLIQNPTLATPTPSGYIFPKSVTEEQAMYAKGFEEALEHLRQSEPPGSNDLAAANTLATLSTASVAGRSLEVHRSLPEPHRSLDVHKSLVEAPQNLGIPLSVQASSHSRPASAASGSYDSETYQVPDGVKIKDEPDDHLSLSGSDYGSEGMKSPPMNTSGMSPIDMETQEKIKLDRKRQRNRLAASKCRKRKLERISQLDDRVAGLKNENADLAAVVKKMKAGVALLKQEVIEHVNSGCDIRVAEGANF
jgi:transcription factor AP-1